MNSLRHYIIEKFQVSKDRIFTDITMEDILEIYGCTEKQGIVTPTSYHADKRYCKVFKRSSEANNAITNFYNNLPNDDNRFSLWDIIDKNQIDIVDDKKYENITVEKYAHINGASFKVGIRNKNDRMIFHISFERDIWIVSDNNDITDKELDDYIEICKNIIDYIFSNF